MLHTIAILLFSSSALAEVTTLDQLSDQHQLWINISKISKSRCLKINERYQDGSPSEFEYNIYVANGVSSCSPPTFEKYCSIDYKISASKLDQLNYNDSYLCHIKNNQFEYGVHTIQFEQVYCPTITCKVNAVESLLLDFAEPFTIGNFRHNMGKYLIKIEEK